MPSESETVVGTSQATSAGSALSEDEVVDRITSLLRERCGRGGFQNFKKLLLSMDKSGDTELSARELEEGLRAMRIKVPARDVAAMMAFFDEDGSGCISLAEFTKGLRPHLRGKRGIIAKVRVVKSLWPVHGHCRGGLRWKGLMGQWWWCAFVFMRYTGSVWTSV